MGFDFSKEAQLTDEELAGELAKHTILSQAQIEKLLPKREDRVKLMELIEIVNGATSQNNKLAKLQENFSKLGSVAMKLLGHVVKL